MRMKHSAQDKRNSSFGPGLVVVLGCLLVMGLLPGNGRGEQIFIFPQLSGWALSPKVQVYSPETLFDYIDGAAEQYIRYGFEELRVAEYRDPRGDLISLEIYRHCTPTEAFGIYSIEQPPDPAILDIGTRACVQEFSLNFVAGRYYVKALSYQQGFETQKILRNLAREVARRLGAEVSLPAILDCFPSERKLLYSEKYIAQNFLGYQFFPWGYTADYADSSLSFQLFIIPADDSASCQRILRDYLQFLKHPELLSHDGTLTLSDPYHGEVALQWRGEFIWGVLGLISPLLRESYLKLTEELLASAHFIKR